MSAFLDFEKALCEKILVNLAFIEKAERHGEDVCEVTQLL